MQQPKTIESHIVPYLDKKKRLSDYATGLFHTIHTKSGIKKAIKRQQLVLNGKIASTGDFLSGGERIEILECKSTHNKPCIDLQLEVLFEDDYLAIVHKPAGIEVEGYKRYTLENALSFNLSKSNQPDALTHPYAAHRLDYATSGALLIGKTSRSLVLLNTLFSDKKAEKIYHAVTIGEMPGEGIISTLIDEKESKTEFKVLHTIISQRFAFLNLVELKPMTGRTHQLRRHMLHIGNPILGDLKYGNPDMLLKGKGLYLHASSLSFTHPVNGVDLHVKAPLPKKYRRLFDI